MTKIVRATHQHGRVIGLGFSDGSEGDYDLTSLLERDTELTRPLLDDAYFNRFFLDFGALCWPNGLELSPQGIYQRLAEAGTLRRATQVA